MKITNTYQKHQEKLQNEARERYENVSDKETKTQKKAPEKYQNFSEVEKGKKRQYHRGRNKSLCCFLSYST